MRIPNYLLLPTSGIWHFRQRVPQDLAAKLGRTEFKKSLGTRELLAAQLRALAWAERYAQVFDFARGRMMPKAGKPSIEDILASAQRDYRLIRGADGSIEVEADGAADHARAMEALQRIEQIGLLSREPAFQQALAANAKAAHASPDPKIPTLAIGKAASQWLAEIKPSTKRKTFIIKASAVEGFAKHYGEKKPLAEAGRLDVGQWIQALRAGGLQTPTIVNKCSYLRGFFDWAKARGYYPHFAKDENPAAGQIVFGTREKRARRAFGFKAFSDAQVRTLFSSEALEGLSEAARWGAWIGLYTGARVAEVGQLALENFVTFEGISCLQITDEGEGQSVKNDASIRTIPVHPKLIELGLLDRVDELRKKGEKRLFPRVKTHAVNGPGQWLSKAFSRHVEALVGKPEKGKFGFHSLRKTVVQGLQDRGVQSEIRAAYVGHEIDDEHHATYSRAPTSKELFEAVSKLDWKLDPQGVD